MNQVTVIKADGTKSTFSEEKVRNSMLRARTPADLQNEALAHLKGQLYEGIPTTRIYDILFNYLRKHNKTAAAKFSLKSAIMDLGPSGFPFEQFVARLYKALDYKAKTNVKIEGDCVKHEIDVFVEKDNEKIMIEAKFHNKPGVKTDVKVLLYIHARFEDLRDKHGLTGACVATNTKLTKDALHYAKCKGLNVLSWDDPPGRSLPVLIEETGLHPITECLTLTKNDKERLLEHDVVVCSDLINSDPDRLAQKTNVNSKKLKKAQDEVRNIIANHVHT